LYKIQQGSQADRTTVGNWLPGLDLISNEQRERVITAWVSSWRSSQYSDLSQMPFSSSAPQYPLMDHVVEVGDCGLLLARTSNERWKIQFNYDDLVPILLLHDIDKPLLYIREGDRVVKSDLSKKLPHGVIGAMMLHDLGFSENVVNTVATHSPFSQLHSLNIEAWILHYADLFSADHIFMVTGTTPFYAKTSS
jgi:putative nucleotidyltransferase with HDIG domain